ncbi:hypothetical protein JTB14_020636 [Gonioctena quinquepunctata]|nr:hypothetical protein JTB14_020636 [Gonioctena quinquepunctata]
MDPGALRNFRDFLQLYNRMTEMCFSRCIDNINTRDLSNNEIACVEDCSAKFIKFNNKLMQNFVNAQTEIVNKRAAEFEKQQLEMEKQQIAEAEKQQFAPQNPQLTPEELSQVNENSGRAALKQSNELNNIVLKS